MDDQQFSPDVQQDSYSFSETTLLTAAIIVLTVLLSLACFHLFARWRSLRLRHHNQIAFYDNNNRFRLAAERGLHPSVLNSLPAFLYSSHSDRLTSQDCAVCLSEFEGNDVVRLLPKCSHCFHVDCIGMWLHSHSTCPLCRSSIEPVITPSEATASSSAVGEDGNDETTAAFWGRRKAIGSGLLGLRIEARRAELPNALNQTSFLSLKRLLSTSRTPLAGNGEERPNQAAATSHGATELDLESGLGEPDRAPNSG